MEVRVWDCPSCGAPLPPAGLDSEVTCKSCGKSTTLTDGSDAMVREKQSRAEAEALFARLGRPPSWSQRFARSLVSWKIWVFGFPFALGILWRIGEAPRNWVMAAWEKIFHERLLHVAPPVTAWVVQAMFPIGVALALLVWSLLGERVDARRELQAMLAAKPPETEGGPSLCRRCAAPLELAKGALGTRCPYCGADNLVVLPADWIAKARAMSSELRLTTKVARERARVGRRRMILAAAWRVPLVGLMIYYVTHGAMLSHGDASWGEMRVALHGGEHPLGLYAIGGAEHGQRVRAYTTCAERRFVKDPPFDTQSSHHCDQLGCEAYAMFALVHGQKLHLVRATPGHVGVRIGFPGRYLFAGAPLESEQGEEIANVELPETEIVQPIKISGWYQVRLFTNTQDAAVGVVPCIE
jgi:DNA-directed RNA polymerase subunit RPC12/RpoP